MSVDEKYCRENLEEFFKWRCRESIEDFSDEVDCEAKASKIARYKPRAVGYVTFKSKYRGKRFFWIEKGVAAEIEGMDCFLKVKAMKRARAKDTIFKKLFGGKNMTELDVRIKELEEKIREINSGSRDDLEYEEANALDSALADVQGELNELYKQKEIVEHLRG